MTDGEVRLRYSGFILFLSRLFSVGTGLIFSLMVTRNISVEDYGVYGNVTDVLSYFTLATSIFPFWATRFIARKHRGSSVTGLIANLLISLPFFLIYLVTVPTIISVFQIGREYLIVYVIIAAQILEVYLLAAFEAILQAKRPQVLGFGVLVFELCKVVIGFVLLIQLKLGLLGTIASVISAFFFQLLYYLRLMLPDLHEKIMWDYIKEWLKASFLNLYGILSQRLLALTSIFLFIYAGELSRAYYGAASTIASIISYSSLLAYALYPRLLSGNRPQDVSVSLRMVLTFAIPMTIGIMILSDSFLIILNPIYTIARLALILLSLNFLSLTLSSIFDTIVGGTEELDAEAKISYRDIVRSRLFLLLTLPYVQAAAVVPLTYIVLTSVAKDAVEAATFLALINLLASTIIAIAKYGIAKKCISFEVPWNRIVKYLGASVPMALVLYLLPTPARILTTLSATLLGGLIYFLVLSIVDEESRKMAKSATDELLKMLKISSAKGA